MGPAATVDFFGRLVSMAGAGCDQDHPPCILYSASHVPDRTTHLIHGGEDPTEALQEAARVLERAGAALIAIPCNTAHAYLRAIQAAVDVPVLDMIKLAAEAVAASFAAGSGVGVLAATGTVEMGLYDRHLRDQGLTPVRPSRERQEDVMAAIRSIKAGARGRDARLEGAVAELIASGAQALVLGCTELPLAVHASDGPIPVVDATAVLARVALDSAGCGAAGV